MKILLIGEYSSLHRYLKEGLFEIGYKDVTLASNGDGWKKMPGADICLYPNGENGKLNRLKNHVFRAYIESRKLQNYDVVQFINPRIYKDFVNPFLINGIIKNNLFISLVAAGDDCAILDAYHSGKFEYETYDYDPSILKTYDETKLRGKFIRWSNNILTHKANIIIPSLYEYKVGYGDNKTTEVIPFPINTKSIRYKENVVHGKIVFFHGLNRELTKGTKFIKLALERLRQDYPDEVEIIMEGHMPFQKYLKIMDRANVVIDQCCAYGYGINACLAMAQGKIVMSGCRKETLDAFKLNDTPMIESRPDTEYIYNKLVEVIQRKDEIPEWGYKSRRYIEELHDYRRVAQQYVDAWNSTRKM